MTTAAKLLAQKRQLMERLRMTLVQKSASKSNNC
jgi:hypothetical protein